MLALSMLGQSATSAAVNGPAFLIPALLLTGVDLATAGWVAAATTAGATLTLIAWGGIVDRVGERFVMVASLVTTGAAVAGAALTHDSLPWLIGLLFLTGAGSAGTASASGRLVVGWFGPRRRGTAMGFRQMAQPLGVGLAALAVPVIADAAGIAWALGAIALLCAVAAAACLFGLVDPARPPRVAADTRTPYASDRHLPRIHAASVLLVIPQITLWTFQLVWLQVELGWSPAAAGALVAGTQAIGGVGRIAVGVLSDRVGSRVRPLRWVALTAALAMVALGLSASQEWGVAVALSVVASAVTVADNGLAFTAVAERAGPFWSGRALGIQNTGQYLVGAGVPPVMGLAISLVGYGPTFALTGLFPLIAAPLVPRRDRSYDDASPAQESPTS